MAQRMVTLADLEKYPELRLKGVSLNQHYDFFYLEQGDTDNQYQRPIQQTPLPQKSIQTPEGTVTTIHVPKPTISPNEVWEQVEIAKEYKAKVKEAKKEAPVKKAKKEVAIKKVVPVKKEAAKVIPVKKAAPKKAGKKGN